jgi:hypothetical protein
MLISLIAVCVNQYRRLLTPLLCPLLPKFTCTIAMCIYYHPPRLLTRSPCVCVCVCSWWWCVSMCMMCIHVHLPPSTFTDPIAVCVCVLDGDASLRVWNPQHLLIHFRTPNVLNITICKVIKPLKAKSVLMRRVRLYVNASKRAGLWG